MAKKKQATNVATFEEKTKGMTDEELAFVNAYVNGVKDGFRIGKRQAKKQSA
jgi:hypothetical protein